MIVHDFEQGTPEWFEARLGIPTASEFDKLITGTGKESTQLAGYAARLAGELYAGKVLDGYEGNNWTERGHEIEPVARDYYQFAYDLDVEQVGFITDDKRDYGCSPDGLVGDDGLLEIKCPSAHKHIDYLCKGTVPAGYVAQVQGQLLVTGRKWCDFLSYHPDLPPLVVRATPIDAYQDALIKLLQKANKKRDDFLTKLKVIKEAA